MNSAVAPRADEDAGQPEPAPRSRRRPAPARRRGAVVLIADDSWDARELYALYLTHCGYRVYTAADGAAAVDMAVRRKPDVIVMDLSMPRVDGLTAMRRVKAHPCGHAIRVILLTGYPATAVREGAFGAGFDVFLTKPCLPEDVELHVRRLLRGDQQGREVREAGSRGRAGGHSAPTGGDPGARG
jgi:CheY-like chemotaxis protein